MLSSLPPELIREIIDSTIPHTFHSTTYRDRQTTLRALSLVSKLFRSIAQPLLLEIVWLKYCYQLDTLNVQRSSATKMLMLGDYPGAPQLDNLLLCFAGLQTLTIHRDYGNPLDLNCLCDFPSQCDQPLRTQDDN
jgi:hypothetical protein